MKTLLVLLCAAGAAVGAIASQAKPDQAQNPDRECGACKGDTPCKVCTNCSRCAYCKAGGKCGTCK